MKTLVFLLTLIVFPVAAHAQGVFGIGGLDDAIDSRLEEIFFGSGKLDPAEKREARLLSKASSSLLIYRGVDDRADLKRLVAAARKVEKADSPDGAVQARSGTSLSPSGARRMTGVAMRKG